MLFNVDFQELRNIQSLMERMGEKISNDNLMLCLQNLSLPVILNEGLISSYDVDAVIRIMSRMFGLENLNEKTLSLVGIVGKKNPNSIDKTIGMNGCELIVMSVESDFKYRQDLETYMLKYGWFLSRIDNEEGSVSLVFEKKFDESFYCFQLRRFVDGLYHITDGDNVENILKKGLKTFSRDSENGYMHDDRVYLFLNEPDKSNLSLSLSNNPVVFKVELSKLPDSVKFYFDSRIDSAVYTYEQIPPRALVLVS